MSSLEKFLNLNTRPGGDVVAIAPKQILEKRTRDTVLVLKSFGNRMKEIGTTHEVVDRLFK